MSNSNGSSMLRAAPLWAKTSVRGGLYLTGRLGGVKVLVMENRDRQSDDPSHHLFFVEAPNRRQGGQVRAGGAGLINHTPNASYQRRVKGSNEGIWLPFTGHGKQGLSD